MRIKNMSQDFDSSAFESSDFSFSPGSQAPISPFWSYDNAYSSPFYYVPSLHTPASSASGYSLFGIPSSPASGTIRYPPVGAPYTPAYGASNSPLWGGSSTPVSASGAMPVFGASSAPSFGTSSAPSFGVLNKPAFGASSLPLSGGSSTPAFGTSTTPSFGTFNAPSFGGPNNPFLVPAKPPLASISDTCCAFNNPACGSFDTSAYGTSYSPFNTPTTFPQVQFSRSTRSPSFGDRGSPFRAFSTPPLGASTKITSPGFVCSTAPAFGSIHSSYNGFSTHPFEGSHGHFGVPFSSAGSDAPCECGPCSSGCSHVLRGNQFASSEPAWKNEDEIEQIKSISALLANSNIHLSHEELRWMHYSRHHNKQGEESKSEGHCGVPFSSDSSVAPGECAPCSSGRRCVPFSVPTEKVAGSHRGSQKASSEAVCKNEDENERIELISALLATDNIHLSHEELRWMHYSQCRNKQGKDRKSASTSSGLPISCTSSIPSFGRPSSPSFGIPNKPAFGASIGTTTPGSVSFTAPAFGSLKSSFTSFSTHPFVGSQGHFGVPDYSDSSVLPGECAPYSSGNVYEAFPVPTEKIAGSNRRASQVAAGEAVCKSEDEIERIESISALLATNNIHLSHEELRWMHYSQHHRKHGEDIKSEEIIRIPNITSDLISIKIEIPSRVATQLLDALKPSHHCPFKF